MKKYLITLSVSMLLMALCAPGAHAASTQSLSFTLTCGNVVYSVISPSQRTPTALIVGSTDVSIAAVVAETISYTDPTTGQLVTFDQTYVMGPGHGNATGLQGNLTTCTGSPVVFQNPFVGPVTVTTVVTQFTTPR